MGINLSPFGVVDVVFEGSQCSRMVSLVLWCSALFVAPSVAFHCSTGAARPRDRVASLQAHGDRGLEASFGVDRRQALVYGLGIAATTQIAPAFALDAPLSDLPPIPADCVRLLLCRHGQTENNRLRLIQGARIDPPLNEVGQQQAMALGKALKAAQPSLVLHSPLQRAQETATLASEQFDRPPPLELLKELKEVDFGEILEGAPVEENRARMIATYAQWAGGNLDARMDPTGESGGEVRKTYATTTTWCPSFFSHHQQVLDRAERALESMVQLARATPNGCIAAVAHSTYLRILLATVQEIPLVQVSTLEQKNCCVNVLDVTTNGARQTIDSRSALFGGPLSRAPADYRLAFPTTQVVRLNESRHLVGLV